MKILIVSFVDDNFGDNLIKICFESLLKVVLKNLQLAETDYEINKMPLKRIDRALVTGSDMIFFAGGGLFGLSYLNFFDYLDEITQLAEDNGIPVIFSSIGINNMDAAEENEEKLRRILKRKCIASVSVRENIELFQQYAEGCGLEMEQVCDPAVWTKYVYHINPCADRKVIGINVVRGGLFLDNKKKWGMTDEFKYLYKLKCLLEEAGMEYLFYTNGSVLDNNTLRYFAREYDIPASRIIYPHTTKQLVETVSQFSAVITFRMHSSIIAYSFGIPSIALVWNDKIPFFYQNIAHPDRAFAFEQWDSELVFHKLRSVLQTEKNTGHEKGYQEYLMSLYRYLYRVLSSNVVNGGKAGAEIYGFEQITAVLAENSGSIDEDVFDLLFKVDKAEKQYLARFTDLKKKEKEISQYKKDLSALEKDLKGCKKKEGELQEQIQKQNKRLAKQKAELDALNKMFVVRVIKRLKSRMRFK